VVHFRTVLPEAQRQFHHIFVLSHDPPFREACWHEGQISDENWLTVLCGHSHSAGEAQVLPNPHVLTGGAIYGKPMIQRVMEVT
jgi:3',5'-cyclic-AMP phosphodiesterase